LIRFSVSLFFSAFLLCSGVYLLASRGAFLAPSFFLETTLLFTLSAWVTFKKLVKIESPSIFAQAYLGSIVIQLFVWISYLGVVLYLDRSGANANAVYFLVNCLVFIALEVSFLFFRKQP
jgi:hypothetical protein